MNKIFELPQWDWANLRNPISLVDISEFDKAFWIGSVTCESQDYLKFKAAINRGEIELASTFSQFGGDMIYAILAKFKNVENSYQLILISSPESMDDTEKVVFSKEISDLSISEKNSDFIPDELLGKVKISWWDIVKGMIWK